MFFVTKPQKEREQEAYYSSHHLTLPQKGWEKSVESFCSWCFFVVQARSRHLSESGFCFAQKNQPEKIHTK